MGRRFFYLVAEGREKEERGGVDEREGRGGDGYFVGKGRGRRVAASSWRGLEGGGGGGAFFVLGFLTS